LYFTPHGQAVSPASGGHQDVAGAAACAHQLSTCRTYFDHAAAGNASPPSQGGPLTAPMMDGCRDMGSTPWWVGIGSRREIDLPVWQSRRTSSQGANRPTPPITTTSALLVPPASPIPSSKTGLHPRAPRHEAVERGMTSSLHAHERHGDDDRVGLAGCCVRSCRGRCHAAPHHHSTGNSRPACFSALQTGRPAKSPGRGSRTWGGVVNAWARRIQEGGGERRQIPELTCTEPTASPWVCYRLDRTCPYHRDAPRVTRQGGHMITSV
jgi:hypothetical protein